MSAVMGVIQYILDLGASVMMPIIIFVLSLVFGIKPGKAFRAAITIGIGFIAINLVVGLMVGALSPATTAMAENLGGNMDVMDVGWADRCCYFFRYLCGCSLGLCPWYSAECYYAGPQLDPDC